MFWNTHVVLLLIWRPRRESLTFKASLGYVTYATTDFIIRPCQQINAVIQKTNNNKLKAGDREVELSFFSSITKKCTTYKMKNSDYRSTKIL